MTTTAVSNYLRRHLDHAELLADQVLKPKAQEEYATYYPSYGHYYHTPYYYNSGYRSGFLDGYFFSTPYSRRCSPCDRGESRRKDSSKDSEKNNTGVIIAGVALAAIAAYFGYSFAKEYTLYSKNSEDVSSLEETQSKTWVEMQKEGHPDYLTHPMMHLFELEKSIFSSYKQKAYSQLISKGLMGAGAALLAGSCFTTLSVIPGGVVAAGGVSSYVYDYFFNDTESKTREAAYKIKDQVTDIRGQLS